MIQAVRFVLSLGLLVLAWRHSHWSIALALTLTLLACEVLSSLVWQVQSQINILNERLKEYEHRIDALEDR